MPAKSYPAAAPDAIGMADALDHDEEIDTSPVAPEGAAATSQAPRNPVNEGPMLRDQITLRPTNTFNPSFGDAKPIKTQPVPFSTPATVGGTGLPADPKVLQATLAKMNKTGVTYEPNKEAPTYPEIKNTVISEAPPPMGAMVTNIPAFAADVYGDAHPNQQKPEPLMNHPRNQQNQPKPPMTQTAPTPPVTVAAPTLPPPIIVQAPPAPVVAATPPAAPAMATSSSTTSSSSPDPPTMDASAAIPENAKKVTTTTTTTTKIVDGKEVTETHVHHTVVVKKKGFFGIPNIFKGKDKKETTTTTTTSTT
jgi:hypothetical protein